MSNASSTYCIKTFQISRINPNIYKIKLKEMSDEQKPLQLLKEDLKERLNYCELVK